MDDRGAVSVPGCSEGRIEKLWPFFCRSFRSAVPLHYHVFLFKFTLKGVGQIHGGHPGTTVQEEQNRERNVIPTNENVLIYTTDADAF